MDAMVYECKRQDEQYQRLLNDGYEIIDDPANLKDSIGKVVEVECFTEMWTPRLLCKLYITGTEQQENSFHLVPLHQIVRWTWNVPHAGDVFKAKFVIGTRQVGEKQMVPALRLPLR